MAMINSPKEAAGLAPNLPAGAGASPLAGAAVPSSAGRNVALDGWRCVACLLVFFCHKNVNFRLDFLAVRGFTGVHMFFVLSGYLLSSPFVGATLSGKDQPSWGGYFRRRFLRIYPPYVVSMAFYLAARVAARDKLPDLTNLLTHLTLIFNYFDRSYFLSINGVYWSLAIEAQFYALLPVVFWAAARARFLRPDAAVRGLLIALLVVGVTSRAAECLWSGPQEEGAQYRAITSYLDWFAAGMAVAYLERRTSGWFRANRWRGRAALFAGLTLYLAANSWFEAVASRGAPSGDLLLSVAFPTIICAGLALVLLSVCCAEPTAWSPLKLPPVVWIGDISYSFFLYHIGVLVALQRVLPMRSIPAGFPNDLAQALVALPLALAISAVMYALVERPCLRAMAGMKARRQAALSTP